MHVALVYNNLNRNRANFYREAKKKGYKLANYVNSRAFLGTMYPWETMSSSSKAILFSRLSKSAPTLSYGARITSAITQYWATIFFVSSHVVISGFCKVGDYCFFGVNSTVANNINIGNDCLIGAGCLIVKDTDDGQVFNGVPSVADDRTAYEKFKIDPPES